VLLSKLSRLFPRFPPIPKKTWCIESYICNYFVDKFTHHLPNNGNENINSKGMKEFFKYVLATVVGVIAVSVIGIFLFFMAIGILISATEKQVSVQNNSMLVIDLERQIVDRAPNDPFQDLDIPGFPQLKTIGLDNIQTSLQKAVHDDRIKGVYLKLSMVNGGMASVEEIRNLLIAFKDSCDKPVYAYGDMFDQKSYYLATVADEIVVHPLGSVDFRGLGGEMMFFTKALDKLGIEMQIIRHGKFKAAVEPFMLEKMSEENREQQLTYMGSLWNHMLKVFQKPEIFLLNS
jgi:protease IV